MTTLRNVAGIIGIGETEYLRRGKKSLPELVMQAVMSAIDDAGIEKDEIDGIVTESGIIPKNVPANEIAANLGLDGAVTASIGIGGAGTVAAPMLAASAIATGRANTVLCYFGVDWGSAEGGPYKYHKGDPYKDSLELPFGFYGQPVYFAAMAQRYIHEYGLSSDQLGQVAVSAREWARQDPTAMKREPLSLEDYHDSPLVADPLRVRDCCLITDGAAAFIMTRSDRAQSVRHNPVLVAGGSFQTAPYSARSYLTQNANYLETLGGKASSQAFSMAEVDIEDVDFAEIYDCFTIIELLQLEDIGLCGKGEGGAYVEEGHTSPGGRFPVNTHGGLLSHAYTLGINHITEAVKQLRGQAGNRQVRGAEVGLVTGYSANEHSALVLTKDNS